MRVVAIVVLSTAVLSVAPKSKASRALFILSAISAAMLLVLIDGPIARWLSMVIGIPSVSSLALLTDLALTRMYDRPLFTTAERRSLLLTMAGLSLVLYPSALGYLNIDIYRLGFTTIAPLLVAAAGMLLVARGSFRLAALALIALVALNVQVLPSANVFDYVVDPVGGLWALGWGAVQIVKMVSARTLMRSGSGAFDAERESGHARRRSPAL